MARPKLGETDTERMQLKITAAEIEAIDDWRFKNRVPSRSEAVRRLCRIALIEEELKPELNGSMKKLLDSVLLLGDETLQERPRSAEEDLEVRSLASDVVKNVYDVYEKIVEQSVRIGGLADGASTLAEALDWETRAADFLQGKSLFKSLQNSPEAMAALKVEVQRRREAEDDK